MVTIWIISVTGFISAVEYRPRTKQDRKTKSLITADRFALQLPADFVPAKGKQLSSHLLVRARVEADLDALKPYDENSIAFEDKTADYQFRLIIRRDAVARFLADQAMGIDYDSHVKETINRRAPKVAGGRMTALLAIWTACSKWQPLPPYGEWPKEKSPKSPTTRRDSEWI